MDGKGAEPPGKLARHFAIIASLLGGGFWLDT